jgi:hypothetical protein
MNSAMSKIIETNASEDRLLLRCSCGKLYWEDSPQEVIAPHDGHQCRPATNGTMIEFIKLKLGLVK